MKSVQGHRWKLDATRCSPGRVNIPRKIKTHTHTLQWIRFRVIKASQRFSALAVSCGHSHRSAINRISAVLSSQLSLLSYLAITTSLWGEKFIESHAPQKQEDFVAYWHFRIFHHFHLSHTRFSNVYCWILHLDFDFYGIFFISICNLKDCL